MNTATAIREKPILFSGEMVRAILEGRKTQTRRIIKPQPWTVDDTTSQPWPVIVGVGPRNVPWGGRMAHNNYRELRCRYGNPGDLLWVRETCGFGWQDGHGGYSALRPTGPQYERPDKVFYKADFPADDEKDGKRCWRPSIHMPRWASRITLEITGVRVERVQAITAKDILAEGAVVRSHDVDAYRLVGENPKCPVSAFDGYVYPDLKSLWASGWNSINGKGSWESNPWVWVVEFRKAGA